MEDHIKDFITEEITVENEKKGKLFLVRTSKEETLSKDTSKLDKAIFVLGVKRSSMGRIILSFDYDDYAGYLYELKEIREYMLHLTKKHPSLFFYLAPDPAAYEIYVCCISFGEKDSPQMDIIKDNIALLSSVVYSLAAECGAKDYADIIGQNLFSTAKNRATLLENKELLEKDLLIMDRPSAKIRKFARNDAIPSKQINEFYTKNIDNRYWPKTVFLPKSVIDNYLLVDAEVDVFSLYQKIALAAELTAVIFWKYTKVIYRFDPDLYAELVSTALPDTIPMSVFGRLPYFCVYIETPGMRWESPGASATSPIYGFYAYLCYDDKKPASALPSLALWLDMDGNFETMYFDLSEESVSESFGYKMRNPNESESVASLSADVAKVMLKNLTSALNLVLYICSDVGKTEKKTQTNPEPTKVKGGFKLFAPSEKNIINAGKKEGDAIRRAKAAGHGNGAKKRPHLRAAHWAGYWTGPKKDPGSRKLIFNWLPPIFVNAYEDENSEENSAKGKVGIQ